MKTTFEIYLNEEKEGFAIGGNASIVPQKFVDDYKDGKMTKFSENDFNRVYNRLNSAKLKNSAPAHARATENNSLILY